MSRKANWYWPPLAAAGVPVMRAGFPPENDSPLGSGPIRSMFPSLAEMVKDPCDPTVNLAVLGLRNSGVFTTLRR